MSLRIRAILLPVILLTHAHAAPAVPTMEALEAWLQAHPGPRHPAPSPRALMRRLSFDLRGTPPTPEEQVRFEISGLDPEAWVATLSADPCFLAALAEKLAMHWLGRRSCREYPAFEDWLRARLAAGESIFAISGAVVAAEGEPAATPQGAWILRYDADHEELTAQLGRSFLGTTMACARCHDHPIDAWKQSDFLGLSATMVRAGARRRTGMMMLEKQDLVEKDWGEVWDPAPGPARAIEPRLLDGTPVTAPHRRRALASWIETGARTRVARHLAHQVWIWLTGLPLVDPATDVVTGANPALIALGDHLAATGDLPGLTRVIATLRARVASRGDHPFPPRSLTLEEKLKWKIHYSAEETSWCASPGGDEHYRGVLEETLEQVPVAEHPVAEGGTSVGRTLSGVGGALLTDLDPLDLAGERGAAWIEDLYRWTLARAPRPAEMRWIQGRLDAGARDHELALDLLWCLQLSPGFCILE